MKLLKSVRFQAVLALLAAYVVVYAAKHYLGLAFNTQEVATVILFLGGALVGGYTLRDAGVAVNAAPVDLRGTLLDAFTEVLDEYYVELDPEHKSADTPAKE